VVSVSIAAALRELIAAGLTGDALVCAVERMEAEQRANGAERTRRWRERKAQSEQRHGDVTASQTSQESVPPTPPSKEPPQTKKNPPKGGQKEKRGSRLPEDFDLTEKRVAVGLRHGLPQPKIAVQFALFRNHWRAAAGQNASKLDWDAAWVTWVLKACEYGGHSPPEAERPPEETKSTFELEVAAYYAGERSREQYLDVLDRRKELEQSQGLLRRGAGLHRPQEAGNGQEPDDGNPAGEHGVECMGNLFPFPLRRSSGDVGDGDAGPVPVIHGSQPVARGLR
jgi:hypothetical protein